MPRGTRRWRDLGLRCAGAGVGRARLARITNGLDDGLHLGAVAPCLPDTARSVNQRAGREGAGEDPPGQAAVPPERDQDNQKEGAVARLEEHTRLTILLAEDCR